MGPLLKLNNTPKGIKIMKTILTIAAQNAFLSSNRSINTIEHKWSARGYGNSKILDNCGGLLSKANGCGYDRFGAALGEFIGVTFQDELLILAKRECKIKNNHSMTSKSYYGMFFRPMDNRVTLDGACGSEAMIRILNKIGFQLQFVAKTEKTNNGSTFYQLIPITKNLRKYH
jgi:hypothetical protein